MQSLRPRQAVEAKQNQYSGHYGFDIFPFHTDLAHWALPPRYFLLRCLIGTEDVFTNVLPSSHVVGLLGAASLQKAVLRARKRHFACSGLVRALSLHHGEQIFRWDPIFLEPLNGHAGALVRAMLDPALNDATIRVRLQDPGDTLIIDNWRTLHGRSQVPARSKPRNVERIYLSEVFNDCSAAQHAWSSEALFNKALIYVGEMEKYTSGDWQFGFWASLSLELIARAALSHVSPTLLANGKDWQNVQHALGRPSTSVGFKPSSRDYREVLSILTKIVPDFTKEFVDSCVRQSVRRDAEVHTGEEAFAGLGTASWLPQYYAACKVLLESMAKNLSDLFDNPKAAEELVASLQDTAAKAVQQDIEKHRKLWQETSPKTGKHRLNKRLRGLPGRRVPCDVSRVRQSIPRLGI